MDPDSAPLRFVEAAQSSGLSFQHFTGATGDYYLPEIMGPGVALFDFDGDGDLDVYLVQGNLLSQGKAFRDAWFPPAANWIPGNRLFRNDLIPSGKLSFTDVTARSGVGHSGYGMGVAVADYDNDGDLDLYVTNFGPNVLYRNNGDGSFTDVTALAGLECPVWSTGAAFLDYDRDGNLDLFVLNYVDFTISNNKICYSPIGQRDYCLPSAWRGLPDRLYRNEGNGRFVDASAAAGIDTSAGPALGVATGDFDGDGWLDLFVANDGAANHLWLNNRNGTFREVALMAGVAYAADGKPKAGMGVAVGDFDTDGDEDLLVTNFYREGVTLFRNTGNAEFTDMTAEFGLHSTTLAYTGFAAGWFDFDDDGYLDLFVANGAVNVKETLRNEPYPFHEPNLLFLNPKPGRGFLDVTASAGSPLRLSEVSRAAAFGDIDNDGDVDILLTNNNGPVRLLLNQGSGRSRVQVRLLSAGANGFAYGAVVRAVRPGLGPLLRRVRTDGSYLAASDGRVHFGLGEQTPRGAIIVTWPDGTAERWDQVPSDIQITLRKGGGVRIN